MSAYRRREFLADVGRGAGAAHILIENDANFGLGGKPHVVGYTFAVRRGVNARGEHLTGLHRRTPHRRELIDERVDRRDHAVTASALPLGLRAAGVEAIAGPPCRTTRGDPSVCSTTARSAQDARRSRARPAIVALTSSPR